MEEDNRSYHPTTSIGPFHFRQSYQQQFDHDELTTYSNKTEFITMKIDQKLPSLKYLLSTTNTNTNTTAISASASDRAPHAPPPRALCPVRGGGRGMVLVAEKGLSATATGAGVDRAPHHAPPRAHNPAPAPCPVHGGVRGMVLLVAEKEEDHSHHHHHHHHHQHQVSSSKRGMVPVQEQESEQRHRSYSAATTSTSTTANGTNNARMNRLLVETHGLLYDYQRRSYRQSLTEQAKELLEQAAAASSGDDYDASLVNLALYSDALQLCQKSIQDHDGNNNDRNNTVGGSYLITGDIRIRRKVELLAAKIYCLRASLLYKNNLYTKCLDDCNSAIKIWNRLEQSSIGRRQLRRKIKQKQQSQSSSSSQSQQQQQQRLQPRRRLLSHKHLYLLKAKALAGLGRYNDASKWLLCKNQVPYKHFDGKSQLIQNTGTMYNVLYEISNRDSENEKITTPPPSTAATNTTTNRRKENIIPTNQNLWPILIHNVQQRLLEGITTNTTAITAAAAATTMTATTATATSTNSGSNSNSNSCTNNAIYQLLRNGPVLFNHV